MYWLYHCNGFVYTHDKSEVSQINKTNRLLSLRVSLRGVALHSQRRPTNQSSNISVVVCSARSKLEYTRCYSIFADTLREISNQTIFFYYSFFFYFALLQLLYSVLIRFPLSSSCQRNVFSFLFQFSYINQQQKQYQKQTSCCNLFYPLFEICFGYSLQYGVINKAVCISCIVDLMETQCL